MPNTTISENDLHTKVSVSLLPVGTIIISAVSDTKVPTGFLFCNGAILMRNLFADLFAQIGTTYGAGDGSTTFGIPDLRGVFPRGAGTSVGYTENVTVVLGAKDNDAFQNHGHKVNNLNHLWGGGIQYVSNAWTTTGSDIGIHDAYTPLPNGAGAPRVSNETKPKSLGVNFFIKF